MFRGNRAARRTPWNRRKWCTRPLDAGQALVLGLASLAVWVGWMGPMPWAMETPCVVCEEVCPVTPKAIDTYDVEVERWDGTKVTLNWPYMRPELCIGCGICGHECPVIDDAAVYVTAIGESRSENRSLLLQTSKKANQS